jgi:hypothetical protein
VFAIHTIAFEEGDLTARFIPILGAALHAIADISVSGHASLMKVFKPRTRAWLVLLVIALPIVGLGITLLLEDPTDWLTSLLCIALGIGLVGYNATVRLVLTREEVQLRRYGMTVWRAPLQGTHLVEGRGGLPAVIPAYLLRRGRIEVGYILKMWFDDGTVAELRRSLRS